MAVAHALPCSVVVVALDVIMCEGLETLVDAVAVVKAPVAGVVAPTVPLMLMLAVPVRLVTVPLDGVPRAPPLTTKEPAVPTLTPRAVATPVPRPVMPVDTRSPVALVRVADDGVPRAGVTSVGAIRQDHRASPGRRRDASPAVGYGKRSGQSQRA